MYIQFSYDLTSINSISIDYQIYSNVTVENNHTIGIKILIFSYDNVTVPIKTSDEKRGSGKFPWDGEMENFDESGTITLSTTNITGECYIRLFDEVTFYGSGDIGGNGNGYVRIHSIKFNS